MEAKILIVEDEFAIAMDIQRMLYQSGYNQVEISSSFSQAIEMIKKEEFDLILLDINLNETYGGLDIAKFLNANKPTSHLFITAYTDEYTFLQALETSPLGFLNKPVDRLSLKRQIALALKSKSAVNEQMEELREALIEKGREIDSLLGNEEEISAELTSLSKRELEVLLFLTDGLSDQELADRLFVSVTTIRTHLRRIYEKLQVKNRTEAVAYIHRYKLSERK